MSLDKGESLKTFVLWFFRCVKDEKQHEGELDFYLILMEVLVHLSLGWGGVTSLWFVILRMTVALSSQMRSEVRWPPLQCPTLFWVLATIQPGTTLHNLLPPQTLRPGVQSETEQILLGWPRPKKFSITISVVVISLFSDKGGTFLLCTPINLSL